MNIKEPEKQFIDDYEHKITNKIALFGDEPGFPKISDYGIEQQDFDGYLFDKQAIMDLGGSQRSQLTIGGFITVLPVLVLSCFPDKNPIYANGKMLTTVIALVIGLLLSCFVKALLQMIIFYRLSRIKNIQMETYIKAVLFYESQK